MAPISQMLGFTLTCALPQKICTVETFPKCSNPVCEVVSPRALKRRCWSRRGAARRLVHGSRFDDEASRHPGGHAAGSAPSAKTSSPHRVNGDPFGQCRGRLCHLSFNGWGIEVVRAVRRVARAEKSRSRLDVAKRFARNCFSFDADVRRGK